MPPASRLRSLDAFRGMTIAAMILVNNPGSWSHVYPPLAHAEWHGWTPTDLIFPFFLFIVGVSLVISLDRRTVGGAGRGALLLRIVRRSAILFLIGLLLNLVPAFDLATVRVPGVLQRIAVVYLAAASMHLLFPLWLQRVTVAALLIGYWLLMTRVPVPGFGAGVLEPVGNLAQHIDQALLAGHMWKAQWDPEGILSTLPAIATCLLGCFAGRWLLSPAGPPERAGGLFAWGVVAVLAGWIWGAWFPINKNLWTSSYVLFTAGMALLALGLLYWIIEVRQRQRWAWPFYMFGVNALLAFVLSGLLARLLAAWRVAGGTPLRTWIYDTWFAAWAGPLNGSLAFAAAYVVLWLGVMAVLDKRGWYARL